MSGSNDVWEALLKDGPLPIGDLENRIEDVLTNNPDWAKNIDADTHLFYSGNVNGAPGWNISNNLIEQSGGSIGSLDTTPVGQVLNDIAGAHRNGELSELFGDKIDLNGASKIDIDNAIDRSFSPASKYYGAQVEGRVITITPEADPQRVYGEAEVDRIRQGLDEGRITHINDVPAENFRGLSAIENPAERQLAYKEAFDQSFADRIADAQPDAYRSTDGRPAYLAPTSEQIVDMGADPNTTMTHTPSDGMTRVPGEEFANGATTSRQSHVDTLLNDNKLPQASLDASRDALNGTSAEPLRTPETPEPDRAPTTPDADTTPTPDTPRATDSSTPRYSIDDLQRGSVAGTETLDQINQKLLDANEAGTLRGVAGTPDGSTSFLLDSAENRIYTVTDGSVSHVANFDSSKAAGGAFGGLMREAGNNFPDAFKGLPDVHNSLGSLGNHIDSMARPAWRRSLSGLGDEAADLVGKGSKILGPLGVAAAGAEVYGLEMKLRDYNEFGLVPDEAMLGYRANLTAHTAQATVDPTMLGGEVIVQEAHDLWADSYSIPDDVKEALEPGSLLEDAYDAKQWLDAQAEAAGMAVRDYAVDRFNNPEKVQGDLEAIGQSLSDGANYVADQAGQAADAVGDYTSSRYDDPSLLLDDAQAVGDAVQDKAEAAGQAIKDGWDSIWGVDEPTVLEQSLSGDDATGLTVPISNIVDQINTDYEPAQDAIEQRAQQATLNIDQASVGKMLSQTGTTQVFPTLQEAGVETLTLAPHDYEDPLDRIESALQSGAREMQARDIPTPDSEYMPEHDRTGISNEDYNSAVLEGPEQSTEAVQQALMDNQASVDQQVQTPENDDASYDMAY